MFWCQHGHIRCICHSCGKKCEQAAVNYRPDPHRKALERAFWAGWELKEGEVVCPSCLSTEFPCSVTSFA